MPPCFRNANPSRRTARAGRPRSRADVNQTVAQAPTGPSATADCRPALSLEQANEEVTTAKAGRHARTGVAPGRRTKQPQAADDELRFRTLFESSPDGIILTDPVTQEIVDCNRQACRMNGYERHELVGASINLLHPDDVARRTESTVEGRRAFVEELRRRGVIRVESVHRRKDGSLFPMETSMCLLAIPGRTVVMGIDRDITERRRAEEELARYREHLEELVAARTRELATAKERAEAADRLKSAFLATMSHELRTPLNTIIGFTTLVLMGRAGPLTDTQARQLGLVGDAADHLLQLINEVLDLSKIEAGQLEVEPAPFDLPSLVGGVGALVAPQAQRKGLALETWVAPQVGTLVSDRHRVEQVLLNLLSNAVKFTERGTVRIECNRAGDRVVTSVADTGVGIAPDDLGRLFQPFMQLDSSLSRRHQGTGLGLAISRRIVELLGGEISARSEPGRGSTFTVSLPVSPGARR